MNQVSRLLAVGLALGALLLPAKALVASEIAVGPDGQLIRLLQGSYGELFPDGDQAAASASVLAIELISSEQTVRELVPKTEDTDVESSPSLYHEPAYDSTFVLWSSRHNGVHPYLRLVRFAGGTWDNVLEINGSVFAEKYDPKLSVFHGSWTTNDGIQIERSIFHVLWWERFGNRAEKRLAALVVEDGQLVGSTGLFTLSRIGAGGPPRQSMSDALDQEVFLHPIDNGFLSAFVGESGRIEVVRTEVLPEALSRLAAAAEEAIANFDPALGRPLEEHIVDHLVEAGTEFHSATLQAYAESVLGVVAEFGSGPQLGEALHELADKAGIQIIHIGARMKAGGLSGGDVTTLEMKPEGFDLTGPAHHWAITPLASLEPPELPAAAEASGVRLFASKRGTASLVAWDEEGRIAYRETTAQGGWGEVSFLTLSESIDRDTAYRILEERTLER